MAQFELVKRDSQDKGPTMRMQSHEAQAAFNALSVPEQGLLRGNAEQVMQFAFGLDVMMPDAISTALKRFEIGPVPAPFGRQDTRQRDAYRRFLINAFRERTNAEKQRGAA